MKKARKIVSIIVTLCFLLTLVPAGAFAAPKDTEVPFDDVQTTDWFYDTVQYVYDEGLMAGTGDRIFSPQQTTTRGMIVTILHRMAGSPEAEAQDFTDVDPDAWYAPAISWSIESGVGAGYGGGLFGPDDAITREQMASFLYRYADLEGYDVSAVGDLNDFADASAVSDWAEDVMSWAVGAELFAGRDNNQLAPQGLTTRAEAATILMRYCENIVGTSADDPSDEPSDDPVEEPEDDASFEEKHEEFMNKDIYDFEADRVLQVDESDTEDNFAVVAEDVKLVEDNNTANQVISANEDTGVYVISNIDDTVRNLKAGDKFMSVSDTDTDNNISIIVKSISISGNTATINSSGGTIQDFYEYIQINDEFAVSDEYMRDNDADTNTDGEEVKLEQAGPVNQILVKSGGGVGVEKTEAYTHKVAFPEDSSEKDRIVDGETVIALTFSVVVEWDKDSLGDKYLRCDLIGNFDLTNDYTVNFLNKSKELKKTLFPVNMPIGTTGLSIVGDVSFVMNCSGTLKAEFDSAYSKNIGFRFTTDDGFSPINETVENDASAIVDAKASISAGIAPTLGLKIVSVLDGRLTGEVGIGADISGEKDLLHQDPTHLCYLCFDGKIDLYAKCGVRLEADLVVDKISLYKKDDLLSDTYTLGTFYCSLLNEGKTPIFGWGDCPYKNVSVDEVENLVVITGEVKSTNSGQMVSGVDVSCTSNATGETYSAETLNDGSFRINAMGSPGDFTTLKYEKNGWYGGEISINNPIGEKEVDVGTIEMIPTSSGELIVPDDPSGNNPEEGQDKPGQEDEEPIEGTVYGTMREYPSIDAPLDGVYIYVYDDEQYSPEYGEIIAQGVSDESGNFSVDLPKYGNVRLEFEKEGYATYKEKELYVSKGEKKNLSSIGMYRVENGATIGEWFRIFIKGTVVDSNTSQPLEGAKVICTIDGISNSFTTTTNADGSYVLTVEAINNGNPAEVVITKNGYKSGFTHKIENYYMVWGNFSNQEAWYDFRTERLYKN